MGGKALIFIILSTAKWFVSGTNVPSKEIEEPPSTVKGSEGSEGSEGVTGDSQLKLQGTNGQPALAWTLRAHHVPTLLLNCFVFGQCCLKLLSCYLLH